jgi:hypothetical protein
VVAAFEACVVPRLPKCVGGNDLCGAGLRRSASCRRQAGKGVSVRSGAKDLLISACGAGAEGRGIDKCGLGARAVSRRIAAGSHGGGDYGGILPASAARACGMSERDAETIRSAFLYHGFSR